jgi:hypothetical protein
MHPILLLKWPTAKRIEDCSRKHPASSLRTPYYAHMAHIEHTVSAEKAPRHTRLLRHTHVKVVRLPSVDGILLESLLTNKFKYLEDTQTVIASNSAPNTAAAPSQTPKNVFRPPQIPISDRTQSNQTQ